MRKRKPSIYYKTEMVKVKGEILWRAVEMPSKMVIKESFFEEDVKKVVKFQNQNLKRHWDFVFCFRSFCCCLCLQKKKLTRILHVDTNGKRLKLLTFEEKILRKHKI